MPFNLYNPMLLMNEKEYDNLSRTELIRKIIMLPGQLNEVEKIYRQFTDNVTDVIWIFDLAAEKYTYISPSVQNLLGYSPEEALRMNWADTIIPEEKQKLGKTLTKILNDIKNLILPTLEKLKKICTKDQQQAYLGILETNLEEITSSVLHNLSLKYSSLSPKETLVANLITHGITNKKISELLNFSLHTVEFHRRNIRVKLGIKNKKVNLRTFLISLK